MTREGIALGRWLIPESEIEERFDTSGGPGGQHANRSQTAVTVRFDVGASSLPSEVKDKLTRRIGVIIEVTAGESRSQWRNRALARQRLTRKLEAALVEPIPRKPTKPSRRARAKRLADKRARSEKKRRRQPPDPDV